jgi:hypothetical protein
VKLAFSGVGLGGTAVGVGEAGSGVGEAGAAVGACVGAGAAWPAGVASLIGIGVAFGFAGVKVGRCVLTGTGVAVGARPTRISAHAVKAIRVTAIRTKTRNRIELSPLSFLTHILVIHQRASQYAM